VIDVGQGQAGVEQRRDFFISYTSADVAWAEWIAHTLEQAGYTTVVQAWDFRPGENFIQRMNQALEEADRVLAVMSAVYFTSQYATDEWTAALIRGRDQRDRLLPVRVEPCTPPPLIANRVYIDLVDLGEDEATARLRAGVSRGRAKPADAPRYPGAAAKPAGASFPGRRPAVFDVPPRNPHFIGRGDQLAALRRSLTESSVGAVVQAGAVHGLGGVGKTQLAIEYAHRYASDYDLVWWIPAGEPVTISGRLAELARRLCLRRLSSLDEQVQVLFDELSRRDRWLLVYDNAADPQSLDRLRPPRGRGQVLITSRNPVWGGIGSAIPVDVLDRNEAVSFLRQRLRRDGNGSILGQLAEKLGDLPLALEQAAAYLEETDTSPDAYLSLLRERSLELFALGRPSNSEDTIASTWALSLNRVRNEAPDAQDLLSVCSFLAPDDIPRTLPSEHPSFLPDRLAGAVTDPIAYQRTIGVLRRYSLIKTSHEGKMLGVHRLVQAVIRGKLTAVERRKWATTATMFLSDAFPADPTQPNVWPVCATLLPHALAAAYHTSLLEMDSVFVALLLSKTGVYLWSRAEHVQAEQLLKRALTINPKFPPVTPA